MKLGKHSLYEKFIKAYEFVFKPFFIGGIRLAIKKLGQLDSQNVLEVGMGPGYSFEEYPEKIKLTAYDISEEMYKEALKKKASLPEREITLLAPKEVEPYLKEKEFPVVVSFSVLSVVPDPKAFLELLNSYMEKEGRLFVLMHIKAKGPMILLDYIFELPCRLLFGFTLLRDPRNYKIEGLEIESIQLASRMFFYPYNHLIVFKKN